MKKIRFQQLFYFSLISLILSGCRSDEEFPSIVVEGEKPTADFNYDIDRMTVHFENKSTHAESWYWEFGDGTTSTEASPTHTYALAGEYTVTLKVNSAAGYSDTNKRGPLFVADVVKAAFAATPKLGLTVFFDGTSSLNIVSAEWDFGDGTKGEGLTINHTFPDEGVYTVTLKATGLLGDTDTYTRDVTVVRISNLLKGSDMEASDAQYWLVQENQVSMTFGYTQDGPVTGEGGCLRFESFEAWDDGMNSVIYQTVEVEAGKRYRLSAQVKAPEGGKQNYLQFYISTNGEFIEDNSNPDTNHFLCLNNWHNWGVTENSTSAVDGDLYEATLVNGRYGIGVETEGVYTATETGTIYIGIKCGVWGGKSNGDILVDTVLFELLDD